MNKQEKPYLGMTREKRKIKPPLSKKIKYALGGAAVAAAIAGSYGIYQANQTENPGIVETIQPGLTSENWQVIPQSQIRDYAKPPEIQALAEKVFASTVPPALQEKAKAAGYTIIYQGDPNDTTGRTILTTDRQSDTGYSRDFGFGKIGDIFPEIRGIFKAWVPKPSDPQQKYDVYALLENPITKDTYLVDINLRADLSYDTHIYPTAFGVDDLNKGYADVMEMNEKIGSRLKTVNLPDDPSKLFKKFTDFPTFNDLLGKKRLGLDSIAQPGDYIVVQEQGLDAVPRDENKITIAKLLIVRRFGGTPAWEKEVGIR